MSYPKYTMEQVAAFDDLPSGVLINVEDGEGGLRYAYSNPHLAHSLGYDHEEFKELLTKQCFAAIYEADWEKTRKARETVAAGKVVDSMTRQKKKDGSFVWILAHIRPVELDGERGMLFLFSSIHELIGLQNDLSAKNKKWTNILQNIPIGLLVYKEEKGIRTTLSINRFLVDLANSIGSQLNSKRKNWTEAEIAMILNQDIFAFCEDEDLLKVSDMVKESRTEDFADCTFKLRGSSSTTPIYIYATCASRETGPNCRTYYATYQNVTDAENRKQEIIDKQDQLYRLSFYDAMTGVKNRNAYNTYAEMCKKKGISNVGLAFCDINGLKQTNDILGHYHGDNMIRHFADILKGIFKPEQVYRLSGDEFVVICPEISQEDFHSKMKTLLAQVKDEEEIASIGYIWKENVSNIQRRTTQAEQIMYVEKQRYYALSRKVNSKHRPRMLNKILKDFDDGCFTMYLQPKTAIDGSKIIGAEALARKQDTEGNVILPYNFVPQLEYEKLIHKLDFLMLEETCKFLEKMHQAGKEDFSVSVNISRVTIVENEFIQSVKEIIEKYDFPRKNLELELTESNKTLDADRLEEYLLQLKSLGVKLSIDDMGNDYATLSLLTLEEFDWVKLDRSLIIRLYKEKDRILVSHIIDTCHDLGLKTIAEGVETDDVRQLLLDMGCDAYQGYLKSKPVSIAEFEQKFISI